MGKETGFLEIERQDRGYADPKERITHYREFVAPQAFLAVRDHELAVVCDAFLRIGVAAVLPLDLEEAGYLAHL